ncbi:MAG TPA: hypothetical protein VF492_11880, partial [Verrucomicrobiae bacterium]
KFYLVGRLSLRFYMEGNLPARNEGYYSGLFWFQSGIWLPSCLTLAKYLPTSCKSLDGEMAEWLKALVC